MRADEPGVPVIIILGSHQDGMREKCLAACVSAFLDKPVDLSELASTMEANIAALRVSLGGGRQADQNLAVRE